MLDYLGGPNVITRVLRKERGRQESERRGYDDGSRDQSDIILLAWKMEGGREPRNAGSL